LRQTEPVYHRDGQAEHIAASTQPLTADVGKIIDST
jgi:hypothetical protein